MNNMQQTTIFLTPIEVDLFKSFREHQTEFLVLKSNGIFDVKNGNITIHFDDRGIVRKIESNRVLFKI